MKELKHFISSGDVTTFAALPGINKLDWEHIKKGEPRPIQANSYQDFYEKLTKKELIVNAHL